jgi:hypothetical protein
MKQAAVLAVYFIQAYSSTLKMEGDTFHQNIK